MLPRNSLHQTLSISQILILSNFPNTQIVGEFEYVDDVPEYCLGLDDVISDDPQRDETQPSGGGSAIAGPPPIIDQGQIKAEII